jgi:hypothetical protein
MEHLGLYNKPKAAVHPGQKLTRTKEAEEEAEEEEEEEEEEEHDVTFLAVNLTTYLNTPAFPQKSRIFSENFRLYQFSECPSHYLVFK